MRCSGRLRRLFSEFVGGLPAAGRDRLGIFVQGQGISSLQGHEKCSTWSIHRGLSERDGCTCAERGSISAPERAASRRQRWGFVARMLHVEHSVEHNWRFQRQIRPFWSELAGELMCKAARRFLRRAAGLSSAADGRLRPPRRGYGRTGPHFALFVHHDDAVREYAYDRKDKLAPLDKGWDEAIKRGWTVVSMKNDWKTIYRKR